MEKDFVVNIMKEQVLQYFAFQTIQMFNTITLV